MRRALTSDTVEVAGVGLERRGLVVLPTPTDGRLVAGVGATLGVQVGEGAHLVIAALLRQVHR